MPPLDQPEDPITVLAEQIARRLASLLGPQLNRLAASREPTPAGELWSARRVAAHYGVGVSFVYHHADELGCRRLGGGRRPRLRFDPEIVRERWSLVGDALPTLVPAKRRARSKTSEHRRNRQRGYDLIEFEDGP